MLINKCVGVVARTVYLINILIMFWKIIDNEVVTYWKSCKTIMTVRSLLDSWTCTLRRLRDTAALLLSCPRESSLLWCWLMNVSASWRALFIKSTSLSRLVVWSRGSLTRELIRLRGTVALSKWLVVGLYSSEEGSADIKSIGCWLVNVSAVWLALFIWSTSWLWCTGSLSRRLPNSGKY